MAVYYKLRKYDVKGNKHAGQYFAHTIRQGEVGLGEIETLIERNCTAKRSDVRAVLTELIDVMKQELQAGRVVRLDGFGRFSLAVKSECVAEPSRFDVGLHVHGLRCKFTPAGSRRGGGDHSISRTFFDGCTIREWPHHDR